MESESHTSSDLPLEHQAQASISLALRLHAEGKTKEAKAVFEALGRQMNNSEPYAVLIEGDPTDADTARSLEVLMAAICACAEAETENCLPKTAHEG